MECNFPRHFMMTVVQIFVQKNMLARKKKIRVSHFGYRETFLAFAKRGVEIRTFFADFIYFLKGSE